MNKIKTFILLLGTLFCVNELQSQTTETTTLTPWYVGIKGGVPFGVSTLTSFGTDKVRMGYNAGIFGGYKINRIFSGEFSASLGGMELGSDNYYGDNWLSSKGLVYASPVAGQAGHYYRELYSSVRLQQLGLHLNIDMLAFFYRNDNRRFSLMLSPAVYGIGTQARLKTIASDEEFIKNDKQFNLGIGGDLSVGYRLTNNIDLRLSSGINNVLGDKYDGIPMGHHKSNFIVSNNISLVWRFGKESPAPTPVPTPQPVAESQEQIERRKQIAIEQQQHEQQQIAIAQQKQIELEIQIKKQQEIVRQTEVAESIIFPKLYFAFNVSNESQTKFNEGILETIQLLNDNPMIAITIKGYADKYGSVDVNLKISLGRANTVKDLLVNNGISPSRIETFGMGVDKTAKNREEARRAAIYLLVKQ